MALKSYLPIITLNVNGLNAPMKRHKVVSWIKRHDPYVCCLQQTHFEPKDTFTLKVRRWRTIFHANGPKKTAGEAILTSHKLDFKLKTVVRDTGHYIILKGSIRQEDLIIVTTYAPKMGASNYISQLLTKIKNHNDNDTLRVGDLNTPLTPTDRSLSRSTKKQEL